MDFWKPSEKQKMRQVKLIYTPELAAAAKTKRTNVQPDGSSPMPTPALGVGEQLMLDDTGLAANAEGAAVRFSADP
ncbi:MAG TPA: hypothetical protein VGP17_12735 [Solirubrobacteraceae bacterium]|jgi:hypothetical protein|nr:hypothetical protein [Solirubrobacteraceae bacterium]